jgi:hypothetical protein
MGCVFIHKPSDVSCITSRRSQLTSAIIANLRELFIGSFQQTCLLLWKLSQSIFDWGLRNICGGNHHKLAIYFLSRLCFIDVRTSPEQHCSSNYEWCCSFIINVGTMVTIPLGSWADCRCVDPWLASFAMIDFCTYSYTNRRNNGM